MRQVDTAFEVEKNVEGRSVMVASSCACEVVRGDFSTRIFQINGRCYGTVLFLPVIETWAPSSRGLDTALWASPYVSVTYHDMHL